MTLTPGQLQNIVDELIASPPYDENSFRSQQKYLNLALDEAEKAEVLLLCAEKESAIIREYLRLEIACEQAASEQERQMLSQHLQQKQAEVKAAAQVSLLASFVDDHKLRGNLRFIHNYLRHSP